MEKKLTIDVEALKKSLLQRRPMKARFKLPMSEDEAYAYLLAAMMAEVEYRPVASVLARIWRINFMR